MQPTEIQVQRSLDALRAPEVPPAPADMGLMVDPHAEVPVGILDVVDATPTIRPERLAEARQRLEAGETPSAEDLAQRMVGRLVCDRLR